MMAIYKREILWWTLLLAYSAFIFTLSSGPVEMPGAHFPAQDKLLHVVAYGIMAWLAWCAMHALRHPGWWAWLYAAGYGATDEWHQYFVPGRHCDLWDWVADAIGAALAVVMLAALARRHDQTVERGGFAPDPTRGFAPGPHQGDDPPGPAKDPRSTIPVFEQVKKNDNPESNSV